MGGTEAAEAKPVAWQGRSFNYEGIAETRPDVILDVSDAGSMEVYETLSKIAPTISLPTGAKPYAAAWQDTTRLIATALGRSAQGDRLVEQTEGYLARIAADNPAFAGRTLTYLDVSPVGWTSGGGRHRSPVDGQAGFRRAAVPA